LLYYRDKKVVGNHIAFNFALKLVDVQMPDMDGYEFVEIIKSHPDTVFIPLFFTAISNEQKYLSKAYDLGH
jgi:response regulator RpfG family c-di-GMP phosphodiesterase